jgi:predicted enzyme related to lactoylglutathione lyase
VTASLVKAASLGGNVLMPETNVMEGITVGMFADPEGHVVGLIKANE